MSSTTQLRRTMALLMALLVGAPFLVRQVQASETTTLLTDTRNLPLTHFEDACQLDANSESRICEEIDSPANTTASSVNCTNHQMSLARGECELPSAVASATEADPTSSGAAVVKPIDADVEDLMERGAFAMEKGMQYSKHVKQLVDLVRSSRGNEDQTKVPDSLGSKWRSIHERAVQSLRQAFELFLEASKMETPSAAASGKKLREVRDSLVELHKDELSPPSPRPRAVIAAV